MSETDDKTKSALWRSGECEHKSITLKWEFRYEYGWKRVGPDWECDMCGARLWDGKDKVIHEIRSQFGAMELRGFS